MATDQIRVVVLEWIKIPEFAGNQTPQIGF